MRLDMVPENTPANVLIKPFLPQQVSTTCPSVHCCPKNVVKGCENAVLVHATLIHACFAPEDRYVKKGPRLCDPHPRFL